MSTSLYFWFIPLVLTVSLCFTLFPKRGVLTGVSAPSAVGCRCCVACTDLLESSSASLRLDLVSYKNKADLLPSNSALTLMRADSKWFFFLCPRNMCDTVRDLSCHIPVCSPESLPWGHTSLLCAFSHPAGKSHFPLSSDVELDRWHFCYPNRIQPASPEQGWKSPGHWALTAPQTHWDNCSHAWKWAPSWQRRWMEEKVSSFLFLPCLLLITVSYSSSVIFLAHQ